MNSRERVRLALAHQEPDQMPFDLGSSVTTGMHVSSVYKLRQALQLDPPGTPIKVIDPSQMLGEIGFDLVEAMGVDVVGLWPPITVYGYLTLNWKEWKLFDGTPVLVPEGFNTIPEPDGSILMYPEGDRSATPSARMPAGGYYFDNIERQSTIDEDHLNPEDNCEFLTVTPELLGYLAYTVDQLHTRTDKAILANYYGAGFGDVAGIPGPWLKNPRGIRSVSEWYVSLATRKSYVHQIFERQCANVLESLAAFHQVLGDRIDVIALSGTDFGMQTGPLISPKTFREVFKPFYKQVNDWVHQNTTWKTFFHSCGSNLLLLPDMIEAGFDIFNPVQTSAVDMDPQLLKDRFGDQIVFWGGGVDTQHTLPFGRPDEIRRQVEERMKIFGRKGGFVFSPIHNIQARIPVENLIALFQAVKDFRKY